MGWILKAPDGADLSVNVWNWRPTLALLARDAVLDAEKLEMLGSNGHWQITPAEAERVAAFLDVYLSKVPAGGRVRLDGVITTQVDTFEFYRDDLARNYSATVDWLAQLRDFCRLATGGFTVG